MKNINEKTDRENYPKQTVDAESRTVKGVKTTMAIDQALDVPTEDDSPMIMYAGWSGFKIVIMNDNNPEKVMKNPRAHISTKEIPNIYHKTLWCNQKHWELECKGNSLDDADTPNSPAYTVKLAGKFAGKTAAQFLSEKGPEGKAQLLSQKKWLEQHLTGQYAASNKEQVAGINDAIHLMEQGNLGKVKSNNIPQIIVNKPVKKYTREKREIDGKIYNRVYEIRITFDAARQYPYTISIKNAFCSVVERPGELSIIGNENLDPSYGEIKLSEDRWLQYIETMRNRMLEHEITYYPKQERIMRKYSWKPDTEETLDMNDIQKAANEQVPILMLKCKNDKNGIGSKVRVVYNSSTIGKIILKGQLILENGQYRIIAEEEKLNDNGYDTIINLARWQNTPLLREDDDVIIVKDMQAGHCSAIAVKLQNVSMDQTMATLE